MAMRQHIDRLLGRILAGPAVWAAHFFSMYGAEVVICTGRGGGRS